MRLGSWEQSVYRRGVYRQQQRCAVRKPPLTMQQEWNR